MILSLCILGCSIPTASTQNELYSYYKEEVKKKGGFLSTKSPDAFRDFRREVTYEEDIDALKEDAEQYISTHPGLSDTAKSNLRELKVAIGSNRDEVELLLGEPDKISKLGGGGRYAATELWIYRISRIRVFNIFIVPIFPVHEGYYLYFKGDTLAGIERHYLKQVIGQGAGPGVLQKSGG